MAQCIRTLHRRLSTLVGAATLALLASCGSGGDDTGGVDPGNPGNPGNGGGGNTGGTGRPLNITPEFSVRNDHDLERTETIRASVPFPPTQQTNLDNVGVSGHETAWKVMQRWPDGSIRLAQAQFTDTIAAHTTKSYTVVKDVTPVTGAFTPNPWVDSFSADFRVGAEVFDTFDVRYTGVLGDNPAVVEETPLVRVRRGHLYHRNGSGGGIGRDYLTSTFYITEFRDVPYVLVDWIVGNDYLGEDGASGPAEGNLHPLGAVDVNKASFLIKGATECLPYKKEWHAVSDGVSVGQFDAFQVMQNTYIDDAQCRRYQFVVRFVPPGASASAAQEWAESAQAAAEERMFALPTIDTWQDSGSLGLLGGPVDGPSDSRARAAGEYNSWAGRNHFGTWGTFGEVQVTGTTGTPRNHPVSPELVWAIQGDYHRLLTRLEHMAWVQAMRPYHYWNLNVGAEDGLLLWDSPPIYPGSRDLSTESLGRRALWANDPYPQYRTRIAPFHGAHGWQWYDHEHWSSDLVFDYWCITGDPWAKDELHLLGQCLKGLMRLRGFATAYLQPTRAEGWCMQGFVQSYLATGDESLKVYALRRVNEIVDRDRGKNHPSRVMAMQGNYPGTLFTPVSDHRFFMPWQHGAVLYGYLGAAEFFESPLCMEICNDVVRMVDYSWVRNVNTTQWGMVANGLRYYVPTESAGTPVAPDHFDNVPGIGPRFGDSPLGGAHAFLPGGLLLMEQRSPDPAIRALAGQYGGILIGNRNNFNGWYKWHAVAPLY